MKLRNKKTGEIVDFGYLQSDYVAPLVLTTYENDKPEMHSYNSLAELNEEWEDVEEPKGKWFISNNGQIHNDEEHERFREERKQIGNYFETKEEAELAVRKLKAWKRLKDKGFRFTDYDYTAYKGKGYGQVFFNDVRYSDNTNEIKADLDLLFGGEE